jgi:hypothetical protein
MKSAVYVNLNMEPLKYSFTVCITCFDIRNDILLINYIYGFCWRLTKNSNCFLQGTLTD